MTFEEWFAKAHPTDHPDYAESVMLKSECRAVWEAAIAAAPEAQAQEPAAWLEITDDGDIIGASIVRDKVELPKGWRWEPVYRRLAMNSRPDKP